LNKDRISFSDIVPEQREERRNDLALEDKDRLMSAEICETVFARKFGDSDGLGTGDDLAAAPVPSHSDGHCLDGLHLAVRRRPFHEI
jgi:hypothetical protein